MLENILNIALARGAYGGVGHQEKEEGAVRFRMERRRLVRR